MRRRQKIIAVLLSVGVIFGLGGNNVSMQKVQAQEVTAESEITDIPVEVMEEEKLESEDGKKGEKEFKNKNADDELTWEISAVPEGDQDITPGDKVEVSADIYCYEWNTFVQDVDDYELRWDVVAEEYKEKVSIENIPGYPGAFITISEDFFENKEETGTEDVEIGLEVLKDGKSLGTGQCILTIYNPDIYNVYQTDLIFDNGVTKKNFPVNGQWVKVIAKCTDKTGASVSVERCDLEWRGQELDISLDGENPLPEPNTEKGDEWEEGIVEGDQFYIRREDKSCAAFSLNFLVKDLDGESDVYAGYKYMDFDSLNAAENEFIENPAEEKAEAKDNVLTLGEPERVEGSVKWFSFTPQEDGNYKFVFEAVNDSEWADNFDSLYLYIEKKDGLHRIEYTSWEDSIKYYLKQGVTYYLCASYGSNDEECNEYTVTVIRALDGLFAYYDNKRTEKNTEIDIFERNVFICEINGSVVLKVANSEGNPIEGATYQWYEEIEEEEGEYTYIPIENATEPEYQFQYDTYREIICEVSKGADTEEIDFRPCCKTHQAVKSVVQSTCQEEGYEEEKCGFCGWQLGGKDLPLGDHSGIWTDVSAATVFAPAVQTRKCTVCGKTENRTVGSKLEAVITTNASSIPLKVKQSTKKLQVILSAGDSVASWTSSNKKIATVTGGANGICTIKAGKKAGSANITIKTAAGAAKTIKVKVQKSKVKTSSVKNVPKKITIKKGQSYKLSPSIQPITSPDKAKYSSKNKKIASVSGKGVIKGKKAGKTKITVKAGKKKVTCTVIVTK